MNEATRRLKELNEAKLFDADKLNIVDNIERMGSGFASKLGNATSMGGTIGGIGGTLGLMGLMALTGGTATPLLLALAAGGGTLLGSKGIPKLTGNTQEKQRNELIDVDYGRNRDLSTAGIDIVDKVTKENHAQQIKNAAIAAALA